ncbi:MAG: ATP-binding protein [Gammaproteobacteria bacterium]
MVEITVDAFAAAGGMVTPSNANARDLELELAWFARLLDVRLKDYFALTGVEVDGGEPDLTPPDLNESDSPYARFLRHYRPSYAERAALLLSLVPHIRPQLLDVFFTKNGVSDRRFTEFGGLSKTGDDGFVPTGETLLFLLAGNDLGVRFELQALFERDHFFVKHNILRLEPDDAATPLLKAPLKLSQEFLGYFTVGHAGKPDFGPRFPAQLIETKLDWGDLVLHPGTLRQIEAIDTWMRHGDTLMQDWGMAAKLRPGLRCMFHGPPGTGKTMTACLLGKTSGRDVYKIDLSLLVSKYIGETEKNLAKVFDQAQSRGWILFFDEADALFGKRVDSKDAIDRYANQEVSFLLQRIETFDGIVILASNLRHNVDEAFMRRFESSIYFPMPRPEERFRLWRNGFSEKATFDDGVDLKMLAEMHVLSGGSVMNVIRYASLQSLKDGGRPIKQADIDEGIRMEYAKEGKGT